MDEYTINNLHREKILLFDKNKKLIYESLDDTKILNPKRILTNINREHPVIEFEEDGFDVVAVLFEFENHQYYGIAKAYDTFGLSKLQYLKYILVVIFLLISTVILVSSFLLARQISKPINIIAAELKKINFDSQNSFITEPKGKDEINLLATRFNALMKRLNDSYSFQKHAIHHISHELKTPISILVSNFERMEQETDINSLKAGLIHQKEDTKNLSDIINVLLEISKVETGNKLDLEEVRIDELIFDVVEDLKMLNEQFSFQIDIDENIDHEKCLTISGSAKLIRLAIVNLAMNCIKYSNDDKAVIKIYNQQESICLEFINQGNVILENEKQYLFQHFFRGNNSKGKSGFGLGLVFTSKIISLHKGSILYLNRFKLENTFIINLPLI